MVDKESTAAFSWCLPLLLEFVYMEKKKEGRCMSLYWNWAGGECRFFPTPLTCGCMFYKVGKGRNEYTHQKERGENCPFTQKAISVGVRLAAPRFLEGLIAFHYKVPPQPIRDRSAAVQPTDTHTLISSLFTDTRLITRREPRGTPLFPLTRTNSAPA